MTHNEFQRLLNEFNIDPKIAHCLSLLFEMISDLNKQQTDTGKLMIGFANSLKGFVDLNEATQKKIIALASGNYRIEDARVGSVPFTPDEIAANRRKKN